jgi:predicted transcriptional regulator
MALKNRKKTINKNARQMSPREFRALLKELREKYEEHNEVEREEKEIQEHENWFVEDLSEITKDPDFDPGKLWGD